MELMHIWWAGSDDQFLTVLWLHYPVPNPNHTFWSSAVIMNATPRDDWAILRKSQNPLICLQPLLNATMEAFYSVTALRRYGFKCCKHYV
jgi:hypothetical protein